MKLLTLATIALVAPRALAHDFWIEPASFRPPEGARVAIELRVGELLTGDLVPRNAQRIVRFALVQPDGEKLVETPILGIDGSTPAGIARVAKRGVAWIAYESTPTAIELEATKFETYLRSEGLERVIEARASRGETAKPGKERYLRSVKALLAVGEGDHAGVEKPVGLPLEIVPLADPSRLHAGDALELRVLFQGAPLANALVGCRAKADVEHETRVRTDAEGRVRFELAAAGTTLVRVVHMVEAPKESGADWQSTWASLAFDTLPKAAVPDAPAPKR